MGMLMNLLTIRQTLTNHRGVNVVLAGDSRGRNLMGVVAKDTRQGAFLFVEIDRVTRLELERGQVDLDTVIKERGMGPSFESSDFVTVGD